MKTTDTGRIAAAPRAPVSMGRRSRKIGLAPSLIAFALFPVTLGPITGSDALAQSASELSAETRQYVSIDAPVVALVGVRLIDGTGAAARDGQTVVIRDGRIAEVGPSDRVAAPEGAEVLELAGHTVIPGIVGLHNHLFYMAAGGREAQLGFSAPRLYLGSGVTTIRTTGAVSPYAEINLKNEIERGRAPGPRVHITAPYITGAEDEMPLAGMAQLSTEEEARRFVAYWAEEGATWLKAYTGIRRAELGAAIDEAHRHGLKVTGHLCSVTFQEAVELGIDNLEHGFTTATDLDPRKEADRCPPESLFFIASRADPHGEEARAVIRAMVEADVALTATPAVMEPFIPGRPVRDERTLEAMAPEVRESYLEMLDQIEAMGERWPFQEDALHRSLAFERAFADAGGLLAAGVDPTGNGGALPGFGDQRTYELLIEGGFAPEEAVQVMTVNGARILGVDGELGSVEAGKLADLVVLEGDLTAEPSTIRNVVHVFKDGVGYDPDRLIAAVRGRVGIN